MINVVINKGAETEHSEELEGVTVDFVVFLDVFVFVPVVVVW